MVAENEGRLGQPGHAERWVGGHLAVLAHHEPSYKHTEPEPDLTWQRLSYEHYIFDEVSEATHRDATWIVFYLKTKQHQAV